MNQLTVSKTLLFIPLIILIALLTACPWYEHYKIVYPQGTIPETVTALEGANSSYDDYNSAGPPMLVLDFPLYFSSNRATSGGTFDVETFGVHVLFDQTDGWFSLQAYPAPDFYRPSSWQSLNSAANEFGPYYVDIDASRKLFLFASDRSGKLDIYHALFDVNTGFGAPQASTPLNSAADDAYPSVGPDGSIFFSSDRNGGYDIFRAPVPTGMDIVGFLGSSNSAPIIPIDAVNSPSDDKAPFITGSLMVFASDRPGGYGGFDLWYSIYEAGGWSQPANFGPRINSASDEFRPVVITAEDFTNDLMIFSSNRPGGLGGFDLYYVGIPKMN